jgi:restriction system protein
MTRYWVIAPLAAKDAELFDQVWQFDLENNLISIGWLGVGKPSEMDREELYQVVSQTYPDKPNRGKSLLTNMLWSFYHEIKPGDVIIARRGRKILAAVGQVTGQAFHAPNKNPNLESHANFLKVAWENKPRNKHFPSIVFPMYTLSEISQEQYLALVEGTELPPIPEEEPQEETVSKQTEFILEKYLEEFIVANFTTIFGGTLKLYEDSEGNEGQQYATNQVGYIDILAVEKETNSFVVIELKKGRSSDQVVGQILRYMGWVKQNLCTNGESVKGLVICSEPDTKLSYALSMVDNVEARYYSISFELQESV